MFWPELDQQRARAALRNALYFLRSALGAEAVVTGNDDSVGLDHATLWCDLDAFDVAVRIRDGATAFQLYRGPVLDGVFVTDAQPFEEWLDAQRRRRSLEVQQSTVQAARRHGAAGRLDDALVWARRAREMAPLNEDAARLVISLLYLAGDRAGALDDYRRLERMLDAEHGMAPSRMTRELADAVRAPHTAPETIARILEQLPLPPGVRPAVEIPPALGVTVHDRPVLRACLQARLGLARRRGEQLGVVLVRASAVRGAPDIASVTRCLTAALRAADLVAALDDATLAILPAEDGVVDINALVGRLGRCLQAVVPVEAALPADATPELVTRWFDPRHVHSVDDLLADVQPHSSISSP